MNEETELDNPGFHLFGTLRVSLESVASELKRANDREQQRLSRIPINVPFSRLSNPAGATDIIDFQGPQPGREWHIRMLTGYASPVAANAAVVSWYIGQIVTGDAAGQLPITMKRWEFSSLPNAEKFNANVLVVRAGERVIAGLTGVPGSSRIGLTVIVEEQQQSLPRF